VISTDVLDCKLTEQNKDTALKSLYDLPWWHSI